MHEMGRGSELISGRGSAGNAVKLMHNSEGIKLVGRSPESCLSTSVPPGVGLAMLTAAKARVTSAVNDFISKDRSRDMRWSNVACCTWL